MIPVPEYMTQQIARRAVEIARMIGPKKSGKGLTNISPYWDTGVIGIQIDDSTPYLKAVDEGIAEHEMESLAGRIIPVRSKSGTLYFRRASADKIGQIPIISRLPKDGKINTDGKPEWVYPAKPGVNFIQRSLQMSVDEWTRAAKTKNIVDMLLQTELKSDVSMFIYGREIV